MAVTSRDPKSPPEPPADAKLSRREVDLVLRRAAELDASRRTDASADVDDDHLSPDDLLRLGEEAGLSPEAVGRALAEVRHGGFMQPEPATGGFNDLVGPRQLAVARQVPTTLEQSERAVERYMQEQLMIVRRHHGERVEWEKAKGLWPGLARSLDFARRYTFGPIERVDTLVVPEPAGGSSIAFRVDLSDLRRAGATRMALRTAVPLLMSGTIASMTTTLPDAGIVMGIGGAVATAIVIRERRRLARLRESVKLGIERFLDLVVARRRREARRLGSASGDAERAALPEPAEADSADD